jgi:hypothetical protein
MVYPGEVRKSKIHFWLDFPYHSTEKLNLRGHWDCIPLLQFGIQFLKSPQDVSVESELAHLRRACLRLARSMCQASK